MSLACAFFSLFDFIIILLCFDFGMIPTGIEERLTCWEQDIDIDIDDLSNLPGLEIRV